MARCHTLSPRTAYPTRGVQIRSSFDSIRGDSWARHRLGRPLGFDLAVAGRRGPIGRRVAPIDSPRNPTPSWTSTGNRRASADHRPTGRKQNGRENNRRHDDAALPHRRNAPPPCRPASSVRLSSTQKRNRNTRNSISPPSNGTRPRLHCQTRIERKRHLIGTCPQTVWERSLLCPEIYGISFGRAPGTRSHATRK